MSRFDFHPDNLGGLLQIYAIPPHSFLRIREDFSEGKKHLELTEQSDIIAIPVLDNGSYSFSEEMDVTDAGLTYTVNIDAFAPNLNQNHKEVVNRLQRGVWHVLAVDANGYPHWCGQPDAYMICNTKSTTGSQSAALNGTSITFSCIQDDMTTIVEADYDIE